MHDPNTVAFDINFPWPWPRCKNWPTSTKPPRPTLITIWHRDPCRKGDEDSCGWFTPNLAERQVERIRNMAWSEARDPWFRKARVKSLEIPERAEVLVRAALLLVARTLNLRLRWDEACIMAAELTHGPGLDHARNSLCYIPGWHSNSQEDDFDERHRACTSFFCGLAGHILRRRRPWYRHPRWHVWHWRIQIHPLGSLKRWLFSRCEKCGKRFAWGESPISGSWNGTGPRWFRGERNVRHMACDGATPASD